MPRVSKQSHKKRASPIGLSAVFTATADATSPGGAAAPFAPDPMAMYQALETVAPMLGGITEQDLIPIRWDCSTIAMCLLNRESSSTTVLPQHENSRCQRSSETAAKR
jgi:hypothetical protein